MDDSSATEPFLLPRQRNVVVALGEKQQWRRRASHGISGRIRTLVPTGLPVALWHLPLATTGSWNFLKNDWLSWPVAGLKIRKAIQVKLTGAKNISCPEDELLICCARVFQTAESKARMERLLRESLDWQTVLDRSWWHRIRPLAFRHLGSLPEDAVPAAVVEVLGQQVEELEQRNRHLLKSLHEVAILFEKAALPMLFFKGPTLAIDAYGDVNLRECGDLDLLIRPDDFPQVRQLLLSEGFTCLWDKADNDRKRQLFACEFQRTGLELDVHWDLAPGWHNYKIDFSRLWQEGQPVEPDGCFTRKLRAEDAVEVLCIHGTRHWWDRLRWICDIAELVNSNRITDWERIECSASIDHCHRSVALGLWLAADLLDARLPADVHKRLDQLPVIKRLSGQVMHWLSNAGHASDFRKLPDRFLFRMRLCDRLRDRFPQLAHYLLTLPARSANWNP
jgi:hypothetical protein